MDFHDVSKKLPGRIKELLWVVLLNTSQPGPRAAQEKLNEIKSPIWTFYVPQSFLSHDLFGFWSLGYPGVGWIGHTCVKNLP